MSGAVAAAALVLAGDGYARVWVANVGDVQVVLDDGVDVLTLSRDHTLPSASAHATHMYSGLRCASRSGLTFFRDRRPPGALQHIMVAGCPLCSCPQAGSQLQLHSAALACLLSRVLLYVHMTYNLL